MDILVFSIGVIVLGLVAGLAVVRARRRAVEQRRAQLLMLAVHHMHTQKERRGSKSTTVLDEAIS